MQAYAFGLPRCKNYNRVGIMHNNFSEGERIFIEACFKLLYKSHFNHTQVLEAVRKLLNFLRYPKVKGVFETFFKGNAKEAYLRSR